MNLSSLSSYARKNVSIISITQIPSEIKQAVIYPRAGSSRKLRIKGRKVTVKRRFLDKIRSLF